ncbi:MAG: alpha-L-fucosidase [Akkermansiaceae bacterium]|nr:alpha-L-fucosidase [Akkermansiaceae bacterium]MBJ7396059.1 alpha-L-fucosidase [Akkermansiaceae bacterium]
MNTQLIRVCMAGLVATCMVRAADLSKVPQTYETTEQRDERMQWFRDAKFGMFIHWGPCSVGQKEIGWGRDANRPWDINGVQTPRTDDPVYDNYYKQFNPTKYNADAWVKFAKASGMKYMVLIAKHHDGFAQFDSKAGDYNIMASPYKKDIVKAYADACHKNGMKLGLYYSTRDWHHPDYLVGDNVKYDEFYRAQIKELLENYGQVDVMWFDHVGGRDWGKWKFDELFEMMYKLQPKLIVNNRATKFCGPPTPEDRPPVTPEFAKMCDGDYGTPEGVIGGMNIANDWESCIHVGQGWSYRGEDGFKGPDDCIKMLVSCTTGGGNLLLNFGPRPDGTFATGEAKVARAMGEWLSRYGDSIYGTRGGPYRNGSWGGTCHKGNKLYVHVYDWPREGLALDPLSNKVLAARTLMGGHVTVKQSKDELLLEVAPENRDTPVTVIELTVEDTIPIGTLSGGIHTPKDYISELGALLSENAKLEISSTCSWNNPAEYSKLFTGDKVGYAFHTDKEKNPWAKIDIGSVKTINAVVIDNRPEDRRSEGLILSVSEDGNKWEEVWKAKEWAASWVVPMTHVFAGATVPGRKVRYIRLETKNDSPRELMLQRVAVFGVK